MRFDYSQLKIGDCVEISFDGTFEDVVPGWVSKPESNCAFLYYVSDRGMVELDFCWLDDDPRTQDPQAVDDARKAGIDDLDPTAGPRWAIFRLARNQELLLEIPEQMAALNRLVEQMVGRLGALERQGNRPLPASPPTSGRRQVRATPEARNPDEALVT